jgi:hypothetical protein
VGDYPNFYLGSVTVAGALAGLLFVALSVAPQRLAGGRSAEHQAIAGTAYTALIDALWISLFALRPNNVLPAANLTFAVIGLAGTGRLARRLWRARSQQTAGSGAGRRTAHRRSSDIRSTGGAGRGRLWYPLTWPNRVLCVTPSTDIGSVPPPPRPGPSRPRRLCS